MFYIFTSKGTCLKCYVVLCIDVIQANTGQQGPPGAPGENGMDGHRVSHLQTPSYFLDTYLYIYDIVNATLWASSEVSLK